MLLSVLDSSEGDIIATGPGVLSSNPTLSHWLCGLGQAT